MTICSCGSGQESAPVLNALGTCIAYACEACEDAAIARYWHEMESASTGADLSARRREELRTSRAV